MVGNFKGNAILTGPRNQLYRRPPPRKKPRKNTDSLPFLFRVQPILESRSQVVLKSLKSSIFYSQLFSERFCAPSFMLARNLCPPLNFQFRKYHSCHPHSHRPPTPSKKNDPKNYLPLPDALMRPLIVAHFLILTTPNLTVTAGLVHLGCSKVHCSAPQRK